MNKKTFQRLTIVCGVASLIAFIFVTLRMFLLISFPSDPRIGGCLLGFAILTFLLFLFFWEKSLKAKKKELELQAK
jgi:hypothetical protein